MGNRVIGVTNALTDILIPTTDEQLEELGIKKGGHTPFRKINSSSFQELVRSKKSPKKFLGGGPTNTIRSINNLGCQCSLIGAVGEDKTGEKFIGQLYTEKIEPYFIRIPERKSSKCYVFITPDGERSFVVNGSVYVNFPCVDFKQLPKQDWFYASGYELISHPERMLNFAESLKQIGTKISFDLAAEAMVERCPDKFEEMISYSDIVFASEEEMNAFRELEDRVVNRRIFVLKKGKKGSAIYHNGKRIDISPVEVSRLINTNGAGDSYASGFLAAYMQGKNLKDCGNFASSIASKVCSQEESWYMGN